MSINSEIIRIRDNVKLALAAVSTKRVTVSSSATSDDLADLISQIVLYEPSFVVTYSGDIASSKYSEIYDAYTKSGYDNIIFVHTVPLLNDRIIASLSKFDTTNNTADFSYFDGTYLTVYTVDNEKNVTITKYRVSGLIETGTGFILTDDSEGNLTASTDVTGATLTFACDNDDATFSVTGADLDIANDVTGDMKISII